MRLCLATGLLAVLSCLGSSALGADIFIVTSAEVKLSASDIREIYVGDMEFSGGLRLVPVDNQAVQAEFVARVLSMGLDRYNTLWTKKAFRDALNPPAVKPTDMEVLNFVRQNRGAIGYVSSPPRDKSVNVVGKF